MVVRDVDCERLSAAGDNVRSVKGLKPPGPGGGRPIGVEIDDRAWLLEPTKPMLVSDDVVAIVVYAGTRDVHIQSGSVSHETERAHIARVEKLVARPPSATSFVRKGVLNPEVVSYFVIDDSVISWVND